MDDAVADRVISAPAGELTPFVDRYIGYRLLGQPPGVHRGLPSRHLTFIEVAAVCGYYDQAHLNRDFVALAGCPPGRLLAEEVPSFQDRRRLASRLTA